MDYQSFVDLIDRPGAVMAVDKNDKSLLRIVCSNRQFKEITPPPHRDGMFYHEHMPRNIRFEDFCYHSAVLGEAGHVYVEYPTGWIDQQTLPMHSDDESVGYCLFSFELTESADSKRLASVSVDAAQFAVRASLDLMTAEDFKEGVQSVLEEARAVSGAHHSRIFLLDHKKRTFQMYCEAADEFCQRRNTEFTYDLFESWADCVGDSIAYLVTGSSDIDIIAKTAPAWADILRECEVRSLVLLPLRRGQEIMGYVDFVDFDVRTASQVQELAELITVYLAAEISNHQLMGELQLLSATDPLTGLKNRHSMREARDAVVGRPFGVINLDLNGLKAVNDTQGHDAGDRMLIQAAEALRKIFRSGDCYRVGGDEFIVLMPGISREIFDQRLASFRESQREDPEVSFAMGACWSDGSEDPDEIYRRADDAMYEDKQAYYLRHPERQHR